MCSKLTGVGKIATFSSFSKVLEEDQNCCCLELCSRDDRLKVITRCLKNLTFIELKTDMREFGLDAFSLKGERVIL